MVKRAKWTIFKSESDKLWYFNFVGPNGKKMAQSEGYKRKRDCLDSIGRIESFIEAASDSGIELVVYEV